MDSLSSSFIWFQVVSPKQMDSLSLPLITFQVVSPRQWTTWVYLHFPKNVLPYFIRNNVSLKFSALISKLSFPVLAEDGVSTISSPGMSDDETSLNFLLKCHSLFVGWRNVKDVIPSVSGPEMSPIKMTVSTNHQFTNTFQISQYNYQHGSGQSLSPVKLKYPLAESDPFLQRIWVSIFIQNKSSLSSYIHNYITSIHNILSQKWCTCI